MPTVQGFEELRRLVPATSPEPLQERADARRQWLAEVQREEQTKALLLTGAESDEATEAAEGLWCKLEDNGRANFLSWCYSRKIGRRPFSRVLAISWTRPNVGSLVTQWGFPSSWVARMFDQAVPEHLMEPHDLATFQSLPAEVVAYRGCSGITVHKARYGMSWTLNRDRALWFARRFASDDKPPLCIQGTVMRKNVFAYFSGRHESEIVIRPGRVRRVETIDVPAG